MKKHLLNLFLLSIPIFGFSQSNVLLNENFQTGSLPASWTVQQSNPIETWHVEDPLLGTDYKATVNYDESTAAQNEWLITPSLNFSESTTYTLTANIGLSYYWAVDPNNNYDAFIKVSTDNGATWTQVWSENDLGTFTNWTMNPVSVNLSSYAGNSNVKIAFQYVGADGAALYVDNVKVQKPATVAPDCASQTSPANGATGTSYASLLLSWTAPTTGGAAESYEVYLDKNPNPTTLVNTVTTTSYTATNLDSSSTYYWKIVAKNTAGSATGCTIRSFTTAANPAAPYCGPLAFTFTVEPITLVNFAGINNTTSASTTGGTAHEFFLNQVGNVTQGSTHTITIKGNTGGNYTNNFAVFIDWNQDGDFADAGETYSVGTIVNSTGTDTKQLTYDITVPVGATVGNTRMRVKKQFGTTSPLTDPCTGASFGQAEDYTLNVGVLAVNDITKSNIKSYPNPVKDVFNIEAQGKIKSVKVFDVTGKQLLTKDLNETKSQIDFSRFNAGVYVVTTQLEDGSTTSTKVIKK